MYRYIALLDRHRPDHRSEFAQLDAGFRAMGLRPVPCGPGIALYVAADTPVVSLPAGGALLGDAFA
ncbi:asparagine synthase, partial [Xanthomonas sp. Kuri4-3]